MAHIGLTEGLPGIRGPMVFSPETTKPLCKSGASVVDRPAHVDSSGT